MSFDYHVRRRTTSLDEGIRRSLNGQSVNNDSSPNPEDWSTEKLTQIQKEIQRREDEIEVGFWPC